MLINEAIQNKWAPVLDFEGAPEFKDSHRRAVTAQLLENTVFFARLGQRLVHLLTTHTRAGRLYEVDVRLRPNGKGGLLVQSLKSYESYQQKEAWTWEHQALLRARAVAGDAGPTQQNQTPPQEVQNLFQLLKLVSTPDTLQHFESAYSNCSIRYGDLKKQLAEDINKFVSPIRERIADYSANHELIKKVVAQGAEKARASARPTIKQARELIGMKEW